LQYNVIALIPNSTKVVIRARPIIILDPQPPTGWVFFISNTISNSNTSSDLTINIYSNNFLSNIDFNYSYSYIYSYSGSDSYIYSAKKWSNKENKISINDIINSKIRKKRHSRRIAQTMQKFNIQSFAMLTLTVRFDGSYKSAKEYDTALSRIRRRFNYYDIQKFTGSENTKRGVRHYHINFDMNDILKIVSSSSFKRFVRSYRFTENDLKAVHSKNKKKKRSYLEILIARWFARIWKMGFCDLRMNAKALYIVKYVNDTYNNKKSTHGRVSYSKEFAKLFKNSTSITYCGYNNTIIKYIPKFQVPIFFIEALKKENKHKFFERLRFIGFRSLYKSIYEKYKEYINRLDIPDFYYSIERLGLIDGY
jgi:hypothetical protein